MPASAPPASAAAATKPTLGKCLRSHAFLESSIASSPAESLWPIDDFTPHPIDHTRGAPSPLNPTPIPRAGRFPYNRRRNFAGLMRGDRKSVVEGRRVSVRVEFGGRRSLKKKKIIKDNTIRMQQ